MKMQPMSQLADVAVIGTGRMGGAMVGTFRRAGLDVVAYNRDRAKSEAVAAATGARVADTAREAAAAAEVVVCSLADDAAVRDAYAGPDGVVAGLGPSAVVCDTSTVAPWTIIEQAALVADAGATLLDTPVSGSVSLVEAGQLTIMVGGPEQALRRVRDVLEVLAARILPVGDVGSGMTMKLVVNDVVHALNQALSEALVLAERAGVAREVAYDVLAAGAVGAPFVQYKREAFLHPDDTAVAFSLDLVAKDLDLILDLAAQSGVDMAQAALNREVVGRALAAGFADRDLSAIAAYLRS